MALITPEMILEATNGGLDIIHDLIPASKGCEGKKGKKFKIRNEGTASANLVIRDGVWIVTDFGDDSKPRNAVNLYAYLKNKSFGDTIRELSAQYRIMPPEEIKKFYAPKISDRPALPEEEEDGFDFVLHEEIPEAFLKEVFVESVYDEVGKEKILQVCKTYNFKSLKSYTKIKNRKAITFESTEHFPIFMFEEIHNGQVFYKLYQPRSIDFRFQYLGGFFNDHIYGLKQAQKAFESMQPKDEDYEGLDEDEKEEQRKIIKLSEVILASGGSGALNLAALGYYPIWLNSESAFLTPDTLRKVNAIAEKFVILYDIDPTGKRKAHEINLMYLDLYQAVLPDTLLLKKDRNGKPCKDERDFLRYNKPKALEKIIRGALSYKFWDEEFTKTKSGAYKINYQINNEHLYFFLAGCGFYNFEISPSIEVLIQINGNVVKMVNGKLIKRFIIEFLRDRGMDVKLRNAVHNSTRISTSSFEALKSINLDFSDNDKDYQLLFFMNETWRVTKNEIKTFKPGILPNYVWEDEVIIHNISKEEPYFKLEKDENNEYRIKLLNENIPLFLKYMHNTCKMYWTVEEYGQDPNGRKIDRFEKTEEEIREEELHLINHIYGLGHILHRYKSKSKSFALWCQEYKQVEEGKSLGGTGKSITLEFPKYFLKSEFLNGKLKDLTENKHVLENVTEHTDFIMVDDCIEYFDFYFFFPLITADMPINPKNKTSFVIPFKKSPKIGFTSNFAPQKVNDSINRRILYLLFSDYYHFGPSDDHPELRSPRTEFGIDLFQDFDEKEWNKTYNLGAQMIQAYLEIDEKFDPPMNAAHARSLLSDIGNAFKDWADVFFSPDGSRFNVELSRKLIWDDFILNNKGTKATPKSFKSSLKAYCKLNGYILNPPELCNDKDKKRIIKNENGESKEFFYIANPNNTEKGGNNELP